MRCTSRALALFAVSIVCVAAGNAGAAPLFDDSAVIDLALTGPFGELFENKESDEYLPFDLATGDTTLDIDVRLRGHSRRRVCDFPPLRLKFSPETANGTLFEGQDKLKLVTHCRNYDRGEQDMLEEYLAYRIFNVISDLSFRVRPIKADYVDTGGRLPKVAAQRHGFVIESDDETAARLGMVEVSIPGVPKSRHNLHQAALVYVFQYLIANTDWSLVKADYDEGCCHNTKLFERDGEVFLVPYDFDLAGLVNAQYAFPDPLLRIDKVTDRLYRGVCTDREILRQALREIYSKREQILALPEEIPGLQPKSVAKAKRFLRRFFERAEHEDRLLTSFERRCVR